MLVCAPRTRGTWSEETNRPVCQTAGDLRSGLEPALNAAVLVGAFDGIKDLTDVLEPGAQGGPAFAACIRTYQSLVELALFLPR